MNAKQKQFEQCACVLDLLADEPECDARRLIKSCANAMREVVQGYARYETLRCLNPREFTELYMRGVAGERFDDMVDELVEAKNEPYRGHPQYGDELVRKRMDSCK